jgi:hypothetical protein
VFVAEHVRCVTDGRLNFAGLQSVVEEVQDGVFAFPLLDAGFCSSVIERIRSFCGLAEVSTGL